MEGQCSSEQNWWVVMEEMVASGKVVGAARGRKMFLKMRGAPYISLMV